MSRATKTILALVLVLILLGIAYIEALMSSQSGGNTDGATAAVHEGYLPEKQVTGLMDSIRLYYIDSLTALYADSLLTVSQAAAASPDADRFAEIRDSLEAANERLEDKLREAREEIGKLARARDNQVIDLANAFYKNELAALPADLSDYEKSVSVKEIKDKLKRYFSLSSKQVNRIANKYK